MNRSGISWEEDFYQGMQGFGQSRMYDSSFPSDTCISVVYVVSCERGGKKSSLKYYTFNASMKTRMEKLTLFRTGLVESTSYMVFSEMF